MNPYFVYWLAGGAASLAVGHWIARRAGLPSRATVALAVLGVAILAGARAHALLLEEGIGLAELWRDPAKLGTGGLRLPGGLILSTLLVPVVAWATKLPAWTLGDVAVVAAGPLLGGGRLACHVSGCCYGVVTGLPWGIVYGEGSVAHAVHRHRDWLVDGASASLPIHPIALYFSLAALAASVVALGAIRKGVRPGVPMLGGLAIVGLSFAAVESLRDSFGPPPPLYRAEIWLAFGLACACAAAGRLRDRSGAAPDTRDRAQRNTTDSIWDGIRPIPRRFS